MVISRSDFRKIISFGHFLGSSVAELGQLSFVVFEIVRTR